MPRERKNRKGWYERYQDAILQRKIARSKREGQGTVTRGQHPKHDAFAHGAKNLSIKPHGSHKCKCGRTISLTKKRCGKCRGIV